MPSEKSCGIVVFREEIPERLYLILHYGEGHWDFPKGHIEPGETEKEAAFREVYEETRIPEPDFELVMGFRERIEYSFMREGETVQKEVFFFLGRTGTSAIRLSREHVGFEWMPYEMARSRLTYDSARGILEKAEDALKEWGAGAKG
jgi:8-oxo-dGTP pyrophosphatase MutT (NUDIX family)